MNTASSQSVVRPLELKEPWNEPTDLVVGDVLANFGDRLAKRVLLRDRTANAISYLII